MYRERGSEKKKSKCTQGKNFLLRIRTGRRKKQEVELQICSTDGHYHVKNNKEDVGPRKERENDNSAL